jgi:hypothetical protein
MYGVGVFLARPPAPAGEPFEADAWPEDVESRSRPAPRADITDRPASRPPDDRFQR